MAAFGKLVREPFIQFLVLGGLCFMYWQWRSGDTSPGSTRIAVTPELVENLDSRFAQTWQRPPTDDELKGLIDEYVKEEIATREATAMGLDRDDSVIRRRLRQKFEFLFEDAADQVAPTDAELQAWLEQHAEVFRAEPQVALRQVYLSPAHRGVGVRGEAERLLAELQAAGADASIDTLGDASMLPRELPLGPLSEVTRAFGSAFAATIEALAPGQWGGPVESPYGLHLVLVRERVASAPPALADVRPLVERELRAARRTMEVQALYDRLLQKYSVTIEMPQKKDAKEPGSAARLEAAGL